MFIAALFTKVNMWRQPKCPSTDDWFKNISHTNTHTHTHTGILLSHKKHNEPLPLEATQTDLEIFILSKARQRG